MLRCFTTATMHTKTQYVNMHYFCTQNKTGTGGHWTTSHICNQSCKLLLSQQPRTQKKKSNTSSCCSFFGARCETWTHTVSHTPLKRARLPIPPISHCLYIIVDCLPFVKCFSQIYRQKSSFFSSSVTRFDLPISFVKRDGTPLCKRKKCHSYICVAKIV